MWAASLRYHKGMYYICFVANDTGKTYLYTADNIEGPWEKRIIEGFYHDCSLLFEDDHVYIVSGNRNIRLQELKKDLSGPKEGGLDRILVSDSRNPGLGFEGSHFYKIDGMYYLFLIHSLPDRWMRTQACYVSDSLTGEFKGGDVLCDTMGYCGQGVAQGGIVDTPDHKWYAVLFQDKGIKDGDYAGMCALQGCYGMAAVTKRDGQMLLVMRSHEAEHDSIEGNQGNSEEIEWEAVAVESSKIRIRMEADFQNQHDKVRFLYWSDEKWKQIGPWHQLYFKMDHFTGCRVGLFAYATKETGGIAEFGRFRYF